jgi:hypothetical protein
MSFSAPALQGDAAESGHGADMLPPHNESPGNFATDELKTISKLFEVVDPSPNSLFQRLIPGLATLNRAGSDADVKLLVLLISDIRSSSAPELTEKERFGAFEELM